MRLRSPARTALLCLVALTPFVSASANADDSDDFDQAERIDDTKLDELRGGFLLDNGVTVGLGATVRTMVDGALALETNLVWQQQGAVITQQVGAGLTPLEDSITKTVSLPPGSHAFVLPQGETAIIHRVSDGSIQNILLNTASGRTIRQETELTLTLTGFHPVQQQILQDQLGLALANDLALASQSALTR